MDPINEAYLNAINEDKSGTFKGWKYKITTDNKGIFKRSQFEKDGILVNLEQGRDDVVNLAINGTFVKSYHTFGGGDETSKLNKLLKGRKIDLMFNELIGKGRL
jgi:hypothetical protein